MQIEPSNDKLPWQLVRCPPPRLPRHSIIQTTEFRRGRAALPTALTLRRFRIDHINLRGRLGISTHIDTNHKMPGEGHVRSRTRNPCDSES